MRIAVLGGAGAMGGLFGGRLTRAGHDVILIDVVEAAVTRLNDHGLCIDEKDGSASTIPVKASRNPASAREVDVIVNFVKCYHTEAAVRAALPMLGEDSAILSLQNGWGNIQRISEIAGAERVLAGVTYNSAIFLGPGHIRHSGSGMTFMGEIDGRATPRLAAIAEALRSAGIEVTTSDRIIEEVWKKLALNVSTLPTSALLRFFAHELNRHEGTVALMKGLLAEVASVARAQGISIDPEERWSVISAMLDRGVGGKASMLQDVEAKRRTEIDVINGAIVAAGRQFGVATPLNDLMVWLVNSLQEAYLAEK